LKNRFAPIPARWQRGVFNSHAQVLVRSAKQAGEIKLTATAERLIPADATIEATQGKL